MTETKYNSTIFSRNIYFTLEEWDDFIRDIQNGCRFKISAVRSNSDKLLNQSLCKKDDKVIFRSYSDKLYRYFIVSNDDRRRIVRFLFNHS